MGMMGKLKKPNKNRKKLKKRLDTVVLVDEHRWFY
jgi:hypothetical protein